MADSFSFGGTDLAGASYGVIINPFDEPWMPQPLADDVRPIGGEPRSKFVHFDIDEVNLRGYVKGTSTSDLRTKRDAIAAVVNPEIGEQKLAIDEIPGRYWIARLASRMKARQAGTRTAVVAFDFRLLGLAYDNTMDSSSNSITTDPDTFNEAVGGVANTNAVHYVRNQTGVAVTQIQITNSTIGDTFIWDGSLADGRWLRVGSHDSLGRYKYTVDKSTASGADPTALTYSDELANIAANGGDWPRLKGNTTNSITINGVSTGTYQVDYFKRYLGG